MAANESQQDAWNVLADGTRRAILESLADGPRAVGEIAARLPVSRPAVSQHLKVLKASGLVSEEVNGTRHIFRLDPAGVSALRDQLDTFWNRALANFEAAIDTDDIDTVEDQTMSQTAPTTVRKHVVVDAPIERAFSVFTERFGDIKPPEHNLLGAAIVETTFEPRVGGHIVDRAEDGSECRWARILVYEPPTRVVFSWDIGPTWQLESDAANASEVEVRFIPDGPTRTRVELEHRNIDHHGPGWEHVTAGVDGDDGWPRYLDRYVALFSA